MLFLNPKYNLSFVLILLLFCSCSKQDDSNFKVEGKIDNLSTSSILAVREVRGDSVIIDTITVSPNGEFLYKGIVDSPTLVNLFCGEDKSQIMLFLEPGYHVNLKADATQYGLAKLKGGAVNEDLMSFVTENNSVLQARSRLLNKHDNIDPAELKNINFQLARSVRDYVDKYPNKIASVILMNEYSVNNISPELLGEDIEQLQGSASDFYLTTSLRNFYDKVRASAVGAVAPDFTLTSSKGKKVSLADFRGKDLLLLFDLKDAPLNTKYFDLLRETQSKLKDDLNFVAVVIDVDEKNPDADISEFANTLDWTVLFDGLKWNSKAVKKYNVNSAPYKILISKDGIILDRDVDLLSLEQRYEKKEK